MIEVLHFLKNVSRGRDRSISTNKNAFCFKDRSVNTKRIETIRLSNFSEEEDTRRERKELGNCGSSSPSPSLELYLTCRVPGSN